MIIGRLQEELTAKLERKTKFPQASLRVLSSKSPNRDNRNDDPPPPKQTPPDIARRLKQTTSKKGLRIHDLDVLSSTTKNTINGAGHVAAPKSAGKVNPGHCVPQSRGRRATHDWAEGHQALYSRRRPRPDYRGSPW